MKQNIAQPAQAKPLHKQGIYRPSAQMRINQERTAELYPHRLYTPDGVGNDHNYGGRA